MSLRVELDRDLEKRFREVAMRRFGYSKGAIKKATEVAIKQWSEMSVEERVKPTRIQNPIKLIEGSLSHLKGKKSSVQLQHETMKIWAERAWHYKNKR